jgi:hypothetical protein
VTTYLALTELPRLEDVDQWFQTQVLIADSRIDQTRIRAAIDTVFAAHPGLGTMFEPFGDKWMSRTGGAWCWAVEPPGVTVPKVISRQRSSFDMRTGRLFAASLLPGDPDRLVLTASYLGADPTSWRGIVDELTSAYHGGVLTPAL